ncbi:GNAT family N-acetyltransferase [Streptomyces nanshensis]|uniref:GNAT family N-acetyltransferase n=1 Tax=Streptomyces nanshensis TaxID=518642 RepID=UPI00099FC402|nr:GNAT family N-acetyltransferase [Streptomyces nanshensis]
MTEVFLRRLSRWQADAAREAVADLYVEAYRGTAGEEFRDRQEYLRRLGEHVQRTGFELVTATMGGALAGSVYGYRAERTDQWWHGLHGELPAEAAELTAAGRTFVMTELMVAPSFRRRGIATRLQESLLTPSGITLAVTLIDQDDEPARLALTSWQWESLGKITPVPDRPPLEAWTRRLPR